MQAVERLSRYITRGVDTVSGPFHPFGGAVDIIVVKQQDGSFKSSPWYVRFGKFQGVLKTNEKVVNICVDGTKAGFNMYLDHKGEAYFLEDPILNGELIMSPPTSGDETDGRSKNGRLDKSGSCNFDGNQTESAVRIDIENVKIMSRTNSRRSRILGLMFGQRSMKEDGSAGNVQRNNSLERAEIAADLLEVRWSTNLSTNTWRTGNSPEKPCDEDSRDVNMVEKDQSSGTLSSPDIFHYSETVGLNTEGVDDNFGTNLVTSEHFGEITSCNNLQLQAHEEFSEIYSSENDNTVARCEVITDRLTQETDECDTALKESIFSDPICVVISSNATEVSSDSEQASDNRHGHLTAGVTMEESGDGEVSSVINCETLERSGVNFDVLGNVNVDTLNLSMAANEHAQIDVGVSAETSEITSEVNSRPEDGGSAAYENGSICKNESIQMHSEGSYPEADKVSGAVFESSTASSIQISSPIVSVEKLLPGPLSSIDINLLSSESIESEELEVLQQDAANKTIVQREVDARPIEIFENQSQTEDRDLTMLHCPAQVFEIDKQLNFGEEVIQLDAANVKTVHESGIDVERKEISEYPCQMKEKELVLLKTPAPLLGIDKHLSSSEETELQNICMVPESCLLNDEVEEARNIKGVKLEKLCTTGNIDDTEISAANSHQSEVANAIVPIAGSLEGIQFIIRDIENFGTHQHPEQSTTAKEVGIGDHLLLFPDYTIEENESHGINSEPNIRFLSEASRFRTGPISIPRTRTHVEEGDRLVRSLPNIRSHIHDLERSVVLHPPSRSVQSNLKSFEWCIHNNEFSSSSKLETDSQRNLVEVQCTSDAVATVVDIQSRGSENGMPYNPAVEISLCRHLLFEGMGTKAASQAFDSEKVDSEKFAALGPLLVKNDKLVVRICGRYFPWDAAAPIILGMISFGQEHIFEPEGMIAIDRTEKTVEGDPSKVTISPSVGNWRMWPFSLKKSKTMTIVRLAPDGSKETKPDSTSEGTKNLSEDSTPTRAIKKKVRSVTPTSEQLASLNLKDGQNVVTFSFSTAMLGTQQVDARIYLWNWNTRIVISDVDGTITKSDVLGQFMPLVGKDWSQSGVTHLFSAIKENGYQFLFLSARAISQAYLTRQFLFNLKQDGKALPDGPVVISPDGLFPSLYREVIRRAPHEFKISCLEDIRVLFPPDCNPFYAGFGNRYTDEISYLKVGIPKGKIFIINPKGEVAVNHRVDTKSYTSLIALVNGMFPAMSSTEQENFNTWNYWKLPLPNIDI